MKTRRQVGYGLHADRVKEQTHYVHAQQATIPTAVHPIQFEHIFHRSRARSAQQRLAIAVLDQTVHDLQQYRFARRPRYQRLYMESYEWVASDDRNWPFSFINICEYLDLSPQALREELIGDRAQRQAA